MQRLHRLPQLDQDIPETKDDLGAAGLQDLSGLENLIITDLSGAILSVAESVGNSIDVSELSSGLYMVHIKHSLGEASIKFSKR